MCVKDIRGKGKRERWWLDEMKELPTGKALSEREGVLLATYWETLVYEDSR